MSTLPPLPHEIVAALPLALPRSYRAIGAPNPMDYVSRAHREMTSGLHYPATSPTVAQALDAHGTAKHVETIDPLTFVEGTHPAVQDCVRRLIARVTPSRMDEG